MENIGFIITIVVDNGIGIGIGIGVGIGISLVGITIPCGIQNRNTSDINIIKKCSFVTINEF